MLQTKGELSQDRKEKYEATQTAFQKLISNTAIFSVRVWQITKICAFTTILDAANLRTTRKEVNENFGSLAKSSVSSTGRMVWLSSDLFKDKCLWPFH